MKITPSRNTGYYANEINKTLYINLHFTICRTPSEKDKEANVFLKKLQINCTISLRLQECLLTRLCLIYVEQNAKHDEAWMILKQIHDTNWRAKGQPEKVFTVSTCSYPIWM